MAVLVFFSIMLTEASASGEESEPGPIRQYFWALAGVMSVGGILSWVLMTKPVPSGLVPTEVALAQLGQGLLEQYFLAFELISVVLLVAMSGAVLLAWERRDK